MTPARRAGVGQRDALGVGQAAPSGKRSVLPAAQPLAVSGPTARHSTAVDNSQLRAVVTAQSTPGFLVPVPS